MKSLQKLVTYGVSGSARNFTKIGKRTSESQSIQMNTRSGKSSIQLPKIHLKFTNKIDIRETQKTMMDTIQQIYTKRELVHHGSMESKILT